MRLLKVRLWRSVNPFLPSSTLAQPPAHPLSSHPESMTTPTPPEGPLKGIIVLDLSLGLSGGYCTKMLRELGAEVIKIEPLGTGDDTRSLGPFLNDEPNPETSAPFLYLGQGKRSVTLDIAHPEAHPIIERLSAKSDVVIESFKPGYLSGLKLDYESLSNFNPKLIMASISWFGQEGPYSQYEGSEIVAYAFSGYMYITGDPDREPLKAGGYQSEYHGGISAAMAVLAALNYRDFTGEGQYIDVSIVEAIASTFEGVSYYSMFEREDVLPRRQGTRLIHTSHRAPYPSTLLPCKDGWMHVHYAPSFPDGLATLTGNSRLAENDVMTALAGHADEIDELVMEWMKDLTRDEVYELSQELRIPFTKVQSIPEVMFDPQNDARTFFRDADHPVAGTLKYPGTPLAPWSEDESPVRAPLLGEHTDEVLRDTLALSDAEIARLRERDVI